MVKRKRDAIEREFFRMLNDEQKRKLCAAYASSLSFCLQIQMKRNES